ncbi:MAG: exo-alpha-sialidase [Fibrobacteria bacterium]|nr:exo-alpha-sialidase [Fibrobacteria bacterium]
MISIGYLLSILILINISSSHANWEADPLPINLFDNPGAPDPHYNSGGRRIVRIKNTIIAICPHGSAGEYTYRSLNNGESWSQIDTDGRYSGCLITGRNQQVFHFYVRGDNIYMIRFSYDANPPEPISIYTDPNLSNQGHGAYNMINATCGPDGKLYVATHWRDDNNGDGDDLYLISSEDDGNSWTADGNAFLINQGDATHSWGYIHMDVSWDSILVAVYTEAAALSTKSIQFATSANKGETWRTIELSAGMRNNPSILPAGSAAIFVFAQGEPGAGAGGLIFNRSLDKGVSWDGWESIDDASTSGYGDPSPVLGDDGTIYVAYRSGARSDLSGTSGGNQCRSRLARSSDSGTTWTFPDDYFYDKNGEPTPRTGTRNPARYQTWYNYGGPLEWTWMQYEGAQRPIYYDINTDLFIFDIQADTVTSVVNLSNNKTNSIREQRNYSAFYTVNGKKISKIRYFLNRFLPAIPVK